LKAIAISKDRHRQSGHEHRPHNELSEPSLQAAASLVRGGLDVGLTGSLGAVIA